MQYKELYILIEGNDDVRFFEGIIIPKYDWVTLYKYQEKKPKNVSKFLESIKSREDADYVFTRDINNTPCYPERKRKTKNKYRNVDKNKIVIVIKEIESWYLAGLDNSNSKKLGIRHLKTTDDITKEDFDKIIPKKYGNSRIDFMREILKFYNIQVAKQKNDSFKYFVTKYKLESSRGAIKRG